jgi:hypothetical protein
MQQSIHLCANNAPSPATEKGFRRFIGMHNDIGRIRDEHGEWQSRQKLRVWHSPIVSKKLLRLHGG